MYFVTVILLLLVLPVGSVIAEAAFSGHSASTISLTGKWFVFWAAGVRLFIAGVRQVIQPQFTAEEIFDIHDRGSFAIVRELGFANLSMGFLGISSILRPGWVVPAALVGGLYYGLAGLGHVFQKGRNAKENMAMISDIFIFLVLIAFVSAAPPA
jgi:hypothetical protein